MNTPRWKIILAAAGLFAAGFVVGGLVTAKIGAHLIRQAWLSPANARGPIDRAAERIQKKIAGELKLTAAESAAVQAELDRTTAELKTLRVETVQKIRADIAATIRRIADTLPPEKRPDFYRLVKERFAHFNAPPPDPAPQP